MGEQLEVPLSLACLFLPRGSRAVVAVAVGGDGGSEGGGGTLGQCVRGEHIPFSTQTHSHSSTATSTTPPAHIRVSELKLLTAADRPSAGRRRGEGGAAADVARWYICLGPWRLASRV